MNQDPHASHDNQDDLYDHKLNQADPIRKELQNNENDGAASNLSRPSEDIKDQEASGGWSNEVKGKEPKKQKGSGLLKGKGPLAIIGLMVGGGGILLPLLIPMLLSLKMFGLVENLTDAASKIPSYAVNQRTEYIMNRAFATWLIKRSSNGRITDADTAAVFCKNGSIGCSMRWTYINDYFDSRYDLANFAGSDGNNSRRTISITPKGRDSLGAKARGWTMTFETDLGDADRPGEFKRIVREVETNAEMKREIRNHVNRRMNNKSILTRYMARKALMKRYGVTNWRGFERLSNSLADKRSSLKASMLKNTIGRVRPHYSTYFACLSGGSSCDKLKDLYRAEIQEVTQGVNESTEDFKNRQEQQRKRNETLRRAAGDTVVDEIPGDGVMKKFVSKNIVSKLVAGGGVASAAGILDGIFKAVGAVDDGTLDTISNNIRTAAYVGYAFGDESGIVPNVERMKVDSSDPDLMQAIAEQFENVEQSPVFQAETGLLRDVSAGTGFTRTCEVDDEPQEVELSGNYVCPERQVAPNITGFMETNSFMNGLASVASGWNSSVGRVFDFVDGVIGGITSRLKIDDFIEWAVGDYFERFAEWIIGYFFDVPSLGDEATGDQNYDAMSAGVWVSQNGMMEHGIDEDGDLLGAGGMLLNNEQIVAIQSHQRQEDEEYFNSQPLMARIFDTDLQGSFVSQFIMRIPMASLTNKTGVLALPSAAMASLSSTITPTTNAEVGPLNPHNIPLYGYPPGHPALTTEPDDEIFSEERCKDFAEARIHEDNYVLDRSLYPIKVFKYADPCALERVAMGTVLYEMGVTNDKHSFKSLDSMGGSGGGGARINEAQLLQLISEYGLPAPIPGTSPDLIMYQSPVLGYEDLFERITKGDNSRRASWAIKELLAGEKRVMDKNHPLKEYLNTAWMWFENGQNGWPDPYQINCNDNRPGFTSEVSFECTVPNWQIAGYQAGDRALGNHYREMFDLFYSEGQLNSILEQVRSNSDMAGRSIWSYQNEDQMSKGLLERFLDGEINSATMDDIATSRVEILTNARKQFYTTMLGKDPTMAAALNSFAVTDSDVLAHIGTGEGCGPGWGSYICKPHRQALSNMMYALWKFDSMYGVASAGNALGARAIDSLGMGSIVKPSQVLRVYEFKDGGSNCNFYDYARDYGLTSCIHTGTDIVAEKGDPIYTPVSGTVRCRATNDGTGTNNGGCAKFADTDGGGAGRIEIELDNGDVLILGHIHESLVDNEQRVNAGDQVGTNGGMNNSWHVHVEYRIPDQSTKMKWRIVAPEDALGGKASVAGGSAGGPAG